MTLPLALNSLGDQLPGTTCGQFTSLSESTVKLREQDSGYGEDESDIDRREEEEKTRRKGGNKSIIISRNIHTYIHTYIHRHECTKINTFVGAHSLTPLQVLTSPEGFRRLRLLVFKTIGTLKW